MRRLHVLQFEDRLTPTARLQVINDLPPLTGIRPSADVYVDGLKVADDIAAGAGTPFLTVPSGFPVKIDVVNSAATDLTNPFGTLTVTFLDATAHVAVANQFTAPLSLTLFAKETGDPAGVNSDVAIFNGVEGLPLADVRIHGIGTVGNDLLVGGSSKGYVSLPPAVYTVDVFRGDGASRVATLSLDLSKGAGGKAAVVTLGGSLFLLSFRSPGFVVGSAVFADGSALGLPSAGDVSRPTFALGVEGTSALLDQSGKVLEARPVGSVAATSVVAADIDADGIAELVTADPPGTRSLVHIGADRTVQAFEDSFTGGVFLAAGDFDGDGFDDVVVTPDQGGAGRVRVFSGKTLQTLADFFAIDDASFRGGARAAVGDVNADGTPDLVVAAGFGGGPRVAVFDGLSMIRSALPEKLMADFFAFEPALRNGAFVAAADVNGDVYADLIFGGGPGGGPRVRVESGQKLLVAGLSSLDGTPSAQSVGAELANFFAGDVSNRTGVRVAADYFNDDRHADVIAGLGPFPDPQVRVFLGSPSAVEGTPTLHGEYEPILDTHGIVHVG